ncbi:MAG: hypothetical protein ACP5P1_15610 [Acidimicrobiales bacterium]
MAEVNLTFATRRVLRMLSRWMVAGLCSGPSLLSRRAVDGQKAVVKFELLADLDYAPGGSVVSFDECEELGAVNLRGTGSAARDLSPRKMSARIGGVNYKVDVNVTGLAGFLLAKIAAAFGRRKEKDWYDIAFVLLHNDTGGPEVAARLVRDRFGSELVGGIRTAIDDLGANFATRTPKVLSRTRPRW